jgi:hypothetical protein
MELDMLEIPKEILELNEAQQAVVMRLAEDGHISDWLEGLEALEDMEYYRANPNPDTYDYI